MLSRVSAFVVWAAVAASLSFWGLRLLVRPSGLPREALPVSLEQATRGDLTRLFPAPIKKEMSVEQPALASRLRALGAIAPRNGTDDSGVVLISLDGRPARALRVGQRVDRHEDLVVQSIGQKQVVISTANGGGQVTLNLPSLGAPAVGRLPPPEPLIERPNNDAR